MSKILLSVILAAMLFAGQAFAATTVGTKDKAATANKTKEDAGAGKTGNPLDNVSREDILERVNGILSHNAQILDSLPEIQKREEGKTAIFSIGGKDMESLSKDELIAVLKKINPALLKIQQERLRKQAEQIARQQQQNMQIQRMAQQQAQAKPPAVYTPPAKQPTPPTPYRAPVAPSAPPRR